MITTEIRAGKPRIEAFKNFAARTKVDDVRALVAMLVQTDRFGTSVAQALRTHAATSRTKRRQRAEERAAKIGVKLVFPLVFFLFPAFYVVTLGPAVIQFVRIFFTSSSGSRVSRGHLIRRKEAHVPERNPGDSGWSFSGLLSDAAANAPARRR